MSKIHKQMPMKDAVDIYISVSQTPIKRWQIEEWSFGRIVHTIIRLHEELLKARTQQRIIKTPANQDEIDHLRRVNADLQSQNDSLWADLQEYQTKYD